MQSVEHIGRYRSSFDCLVQIIRLEVCARDRSCAAACSARRHPSTGPHWLLAGTGRALWPWAGRDRLAQLHVQR
eukprot:6159375-Prymnesium_polylepis.1